MCWWRIGNASGETETWVKVTSQGERQHFGSDIQEESTSSRLLKARCSSYFLLNIFSLVALTNSFCILRVTHGRCGEGSKLRSWTGPLHLFWIPCSPAVCFLKPNLLGTCEWFLEPGGSMEKHRITALKYKLARPLVEAFLSLWETSGIRTWSTLENTSPEQGERITKLFWDVPV